MKSLKCYPLLLGVLIVLPILGCQSGDPAPAHDPAVSLQNQSDVSLKADRSQFDELRKEIPEDIRRENDELAFVRQMMASGDEDPAKVRERWSKALRDRREKFDRALRKSREEFNKKERREREAFLKKSKLNRESFLRDAKRLKPADRKEFFDEQDAQRQDFFNDERDNRKDFESRATEERKSFEAYIAERSNLFNQEAREYSSTYYERKKQLDVKKRAEEKAKLKTSSANSGSGSASKATDQPVTDPDLDEFKQMQKVPPTRLAPPDSN